MNGIQAESLSRRLPSPEAAAFAFAVPATAVGWVNLMGPVAIFVPAPLCELRKD